MPRCRGVKAPTSTVYDLHDFQSRTADGPVTGLIQSMGSKPLAFTGEVRVSGRSTAMEIIEGIDAPGVRVDPVGDAEDCHKARRSMKSWPRCIVEGADGGHGHDGSPER